VTDRVLRCDNHRLLIAQSGWPADQIGRFDPKRVSESIHNVDAGRINATFTRADIAAVDLRPISEFLQRLLFRCRQSFELQVKVS
jgi:hypothetical protein